MTEKDTINLIKLDGKNYQMWKFGISFLLDAKELTEFIDGTDEEPNKTANLNDWKVWKKNRSQAAVILLSSVDQALHPNLINCTSPEALWNKLHALYGEASEDAAVTAWQQYYDFKITDSEPVNGQIEKFGSICNKLESENEKPTEKSKISKLLNSLTPRFSAFRMAWECTAKNDQKFENLLVRIIREDKRLKESEEEMSALALQVNSVRMKNVDDVKINSATVMDREERAKKIRELKKRTKCHYCKQTGHWARECWERRDRAEKCEKDSGNKSSECTTISDAYVCEVSVLNTETTLEEKDIWIGDTGASMHMTPCRSYFCHLEPSTTIPHVRTADHQLLPTAGIGTINVQADLNGKFYDRQLTNVLFVPTLKRNLFSITAVNTKKFSFHSYKEHCQVKDRDGKLSCVGVRHGSLFRMLLRVVIPVECNLAVAPTLKLWHARMGHINVQAIKVLENSAAVAGLNINSREDFFCEPCVLGKQTRKPHKIVEKEKNFQPGEMIHTDVCGPINVESPRGSKYFVLFKDEFSGYRVVYFLRQKSEVFAEFKKFESLILRQTGNKLKVLRSDNGTEYTSFQFSDFLKEKGIVHEFSSPYIHEQNGRAEREIRTITDCARSMMIGKTVAKQLWTEAVNTAVYLLNRVLCKQNKNKTAYELWFKQKPEVDHLKIFGSVAYLNIPKEKRSKFEPKSKKMIFVGYDNNSKNYRLWDHENRKIYVSSDVDFNEEVEDQKNEGGKRDLFSFELDVNESKTNSKENVDINEEGIQNLVQNQDENINVNNEENRGVNERLQNRNSLRRPDWYGLPLAYSVDLVPSSYDEARLSDDFNKWKNAMNEEMAALKENLTWKLCELPAGRQAIGCKWVYALKTNGEGNIVRYKARLVAKGFAQREGIDYFETFAPVVRYESIRLILSICASQDLEMSKFDIKTAFLYGELREDIYMEQPRGYECGQNLVCRLNRSLYGLKQSPRCWNEKFVKFLNKFSFQSLESDKCVFIGTVNEDILYLVLYVDDGLIASKSQSAIDKVLCNLQSEFKITADNKVDQYIGFEIERDRKNQTLKIKQSNYIKKILQRFAMDEANAVNVPAEPGLILSAINSNEKDEKETRDIVPYREAVGSLLFAARVTRPDIEYAVNTASQFLNNYRTIHWNAVKRILRYLAGTIDYGIVYGKSGSMLDLIGYTDADYAGCLDTRRSRSGFIYLLNNAPISWCSQRQEIVSLSTTEAEYIALAHGTKDAIWLQRMLSELKIQVERVRIHVDNQSAIKLASNPEFHKRSKHIDVRYHFIREIVEKGLIEINYVKTHDQRADILTKPLSKERFCYLRDLINVTR